MSDWLVRLEALSKWSADIKKRTADAAAEAQLLFRAYDEEPEMRGFVGGKMRELAVAERPLLEESQEMLGALKAFIDEAQMTGVTVSEAMGLTREQCGAMEFNPTEKFSEFVSRQMR